MSSDFFPPADRALELAAHIPCVDPIRDDHDLWRLYESADRMRLAADLLVAPYRRSGITKVLGKESRGFLLGGVCALALDAGFVAARKYDGYMPGAKIHRVAEPDWEGKQPIFQMLERSLERSDRVLVVDDWYTTGNQCRAVREIVEELGATFVGASVMVEEGCSSLSDLGRFNALLRWERDRLAFSASPYSLLGAADAAAHQLGSA